MTEITPVESAQELVRSKNAGHCSWALGILEHELIELAGGSRDKVSILDLGQSYENNLKFYSRFSRRVYFDDIASTLRESKSATSSHNSEAHLFEDLPNCHGNLKFDFIICWDLLNYCNSAQLSALGKILAQCSHPQTRLLALIWNRNSIPAEPLRFKIGSDSVIHYEPTVAKVAEHVPLSKTELARHLVSFSRFRTILLRNGIEECILRSNLKAEMSELKVEQVASLADQVATPVESSADSETTPSAASNAIEQVTA